MRRNDLATVTIDKFVFGGAGLGRVGERARPNDHSVGRVVFIWGALPGETVEFCVTKKKRNFIEGAVSRVIIPSPHRREPADDHYLSCSPWQVMAYEEELKWKQAIALETYQKIGNLAMADIEMVSDGREYGYRNKMEYNFVSREGKPALAFHARGTHRLAPAGDCALAAPEIIAADHKLLSWLDKEQVPVACLKSVIVRCDTSGRAALTLFLKQKFAFASPLPLDNQLVGFQCYYSDWRSPASVPTELLYRSGAEYLETEIRGVKLRYGPLSFFQVNVPMFAIALQDIARWVAGGAVVDFYSGIGAISLPLAVQCQSLQLVEENAEAVEGARQNILRCGIVNAQAAAARSEAALEYIVPEATVILDPPRTGLHPDLVSRLIDVRPKRIIYLSCGLDTQARDVGRLLAAYRPVFWKLYNFFPRTPHVEALCVLARQDLPKGLP